MVVTKIFIGARLKQYFRGVDVMEARSKVQRRVSVLILPIKECSAFRQSGYNSYIFCHNVYVVIHQFISRIATR